LREQVSSTPPRHSSRSALSALATKYLPGDGESLVEIVAEDEAGNEGGDSITLICNTPPVIRITSVVWSPKSTDEQAKCRILGTIDDTAETTTIEGISLTAIDGQVVTGVNNQDGTFMVDGIDLFAGLNSIEVTATDAHGLEGMDCVVVIGEGIMSFPDGEEVPEPDEGEPGLGGAPPIVLNVTAAGGVPLALAGPLAADDVTLLADGAADARVWKASDLSFNVTGIRDWAEWYVRKMNLRAGLDPDGPVGGRYYLYTLEVTWADIDLPEAEPELTVFRRATVPGEGTVLNHNLVPAINALRAANDEPQIGFLDETFVHWQADATTAGRTNGPIRAKINILMEIEWLDGDEWVFRGASLTSTGVHVLVDEITEAIVEVFDKDGTEVLSSATVNKSSTSVPVLTYQPPIKDTAGNTDDTFDVKLTAKTKYGTNGLLDEVRWAIKQHDTRDPHDTEHNGIKVGSGFRLSGIHLGVTYIMAFGEATTEDDAPVCPTQASAGPRPDCLPTSRYTGSLGNFFYPLREILAGPKPEVPVSDGLLVAKRGIPMSTRAGYELESVMPWGTPFTIVAARTQELAWIDAEDKTTPITDPNVHPTAGKANGVRYFPGARDNTKPDEWHDRVAIRHTIYPDLPGIPVYLKVLDPDDPSADKTPIDDETGGPGDDNRNQTAGLLLYPYTETLRLPTPLAQGTTTNGGETVFGWSWGFQRDYVEFWVAKQPGDNHRVAATLFKMDGTGIESITDHSAPGSNAQMPGTRTRLSKLLTIWRRLYVEMDRMKPPTDPSEYKPDWQVIMPSRAESRGCNWTRIYVTDQAGLEHVIADAFQSGTLSLYSATSAKAFVGDGAANITGNAVYDKAESEWWVDIGREIPPSWRDGAGKVRRLILQDDDPRSTKAERESGLLRLPKIDGYVTKEYSKAYIAIQGCPSGWNSRDFVPFRPHMDVTKLAKRLHLLHNPDGSDLPSSEAFCSARVLVAHEGHEVRKRFDPNRGGCVLGETKPTSLVVRSNTALIFSETLRDRNEWTKILGRKDPMTYEGTMAHEIAHLGGAMDGDGGLMNASTRRSADRVLHAKSLNYMRSQRQWGRYE